MRNIRENMGFRQCPQSTIPTPFSHQISHSGEQVTFQDCRQQEAEIREQVFDKLNQILCEFLELDNIAKHEGVLLLLRRKIFAEIGKQITHDHDHDLDLDLDLDKFIVEWLNQYSQVKVISEFLQSYQEVDYDKQAEIVQFRGLHNHLITEGSNFPSSCKLERFKVKTVNPVVLTITKK